VPGGRYENFAYYGHEKEQILRRAFPGIRPGEGRRYFFNSAALKKDRPLKRSMGLSGG